MSVNYFRRITGKVLSKTEQIPGVYKVMLEAEGDDWGHQYYVKKDVFDSLIVEHVQSFDGALVN